jgi:restriction system protein
MVSFVDNVVKIDTDKEYWYLRTEGGEFYNDFNENNYIGIGWNYITSSELYEENTVNLRDKIINNNTTKYGNTVFDNLDPGKKSSISKNINQLFTFKALKKGDIVLIPSTDSNFFSIGEIDDDYIYNPSEEELINCYYTKRRKVKWLKKSTEHNYYNSLFFSLKHSHQTIVSIKKHADFIDSLSEELYLKGDDCFLSLKINREEDINLKDLKDLFDNYYLLLEKVNKEFQFNEKIDITSVKLSLNSPGFINIKLLTGKSLIISSLIISMSLSGCTNDQINEKIKDETGKEINIEDHGYSNTIDSIRVIRKNLNVPNDSIHSNF